jgi:hypothetical protein
MVCAFSFLRNIFTPRKKTETPLAPPPDYVQVCSTSQPDISEKSPHCEESPFLNPNLHFTATDIESHLSSKDARFAAAVVELMLPRLKLGVWQEPVGWGHYSFTLDKVQTLLKGDKNLIPRRRILDVTRMHVNVIKQLGGII